LDPARFWELTPRLFMLEMAGAAMRHERDRALVWWGAMMPHMKTKPGFSEFTGIKKTEARRDWESDLSKWQAYAASKGH